MRYSSPFPFALPLLVCCARSPLEIASLHPGNRISLIHPVAGQTSRYLRFERGSERRPVRGSNGSSPPSFSWLPDTLELKITTLTETGFVIEEHLTPGSRSVQNGEERDSTIRYSVYTAGDSVWEGIWMSRGSRRIFRREGLFGYASQPMHFRPQHDSAVTLTEWGTVDALDTMKFEGIVRDLTLWGRQYDQLNVVIDDTPMHTDGEGITVVYGKEEGIVSVAVKGSWFDTVSGWALL